MPNTVLILDATVSGGASSREAVFAAAAGYNVEVVDDATWLSKSTADFSTYRAIVLGDATCTFGAAIAAAEASVGNWGPAINGNVIVVGTDPVFHQSQGGDSVTDGAVKFAAAEPAKTGAYISLSCYYHDTAPTTSVPVLSPFGTFTVTGVGCYNDAHKVAEHPALAGITDATISNWSCSVHEAFDGFPASFLPLAIARGISGPGSLSFADGSFGIPYIMARGEELVPAACGDGVRQDPEECDDGNTDNGDGCSAQCLFECGNGVVDAGEQCDDGNRDPGDGCSPSCQLENRPPSCDAAGASISALWPPNHKMVGISVVGVTDPDGDPLTLSVTGVTQDEAVSERGAGAGNTAPDATLSPLAVRAERNGNPRTKGDGRVYHVAFTASDGQGGSCSGSADVCVPHDQGAHATCVDGGPLFDSTRK